MATKEKIYRSSQSCNPIHLAECDSDVSYSNCNQKDTRNEICSKYTNNSHIQEAMHFPMKTSFTTDTNEISSSMRNSAVSGNTDLIEEEVQQPSLSNSIEKNQCCDSTHSENCKLTSLVDLIRRDTFTFTMMTKVLRQNQLNTLQYLELAGMNLKKSSILALCHCSGSLPEIKSLNLSGNPLGNASLKLISEIPSWLKLQILILQDIKIDHQGTKELAMNESWKKIEEIDLSQNPLIGDIGVMNLSFNKTWIRLKKLSLWDCNVKALGLKYLRRAGIFKACSVINRLTTEDKSMTLVFEKELFKESLKKHHNTTLCIPIETLSQYSKTKSNIFNDSRKFLLTTNWFLRGGFPENCNLSSDILKLLTKFDQYKQKILSDISVEDEMQLYIKFHSKKEQNDFILDNIKRKYGNYAYAYDEKETLELAFDISKNFLYTSGQTKANILLLTGSVGTGKSLFCRYLQRELLYSWTNPQSYKEEPDAWFPIYVDLSYTKEFKAETLFDAIEQELSLTKEEMQTLQTTETHNSSWLKLLIIIDGCDRGIQELLNGYSKSEEDCMKYNIPFKVGLEKFKTAKVVFVCREESLKHPLRRELLFSPFCHEESSSQPILAPELFLQRKIEPFSDNQITCYLRKYYFNRLIKVNEMKPRQDASFASQGLLSWTRANELEQQIEEYDLRELARMPFMLKVIAELLFSPYFDISCSALKQLKPFSSYYLIESFINMKLQFDFEQRLTSSVTAKNEGEGDQSEEIQAREQYIKIMKHQLRSLALELAGYSINSANKSISRNINETLVTESNSLIEWDSNLSTIKFRYPFIMEFLVAEQIKEEIIQQKSTSPITIQKEILLNQQMVSGLTLMFLSDAVNDERISADQLMDLVKLSGQKHIDEGPQDKELRNYIEKLTNQELKPMVITREYIESEEELSIDACSHLDFTIVAANAITILNYAGDCFNNENLSNICNGGADISNESFEGNLKNKNLSNICIKGADLSNGNFEGTCFAGANLQGVNFSGA